MPTLQKTKEKILAKIDEQYNPELALTWTRAYMELAHAEQHEAITAEIRAGNTYGAEGSANEFDGLEDIG